MRVRWRRVLAAAGSLLAALAVAVSAYAMHAAHPAARERLLLAAAFAVVHGVALSSLAPWEPRLLGLWALTMLLAGVLLFAGSLTAAALLGAPTVLAPVGGSLLILGWLLHGADRLRD
ncbi:Protein of unknown function [Thermomonas hydrothermalis]|uniref:DUF423 domain-containing protein n=2 Tax=Thermomonas hydrothermalis TaxID=213588 RepID=A0A1M4S7V5_9GAMM|nr:Protein of unknown function [Thermomonas hydrothermalis]